MRSKKQLRFSELSHLFAVLTLALLAVSSVALGQTEDPSDQDITQAVESHFWGDEVINPNNLDVSTYEGIVTLSGSVENILSKDRAAQIAGMIRGVRGVVNQIRVKPSVVATDSELRKSVQDALLENPATDSYEVRVKALDGVVTLTGNVDSWQEKQLCVVVAKGVQGVREIENDIQVDYKRERPDLEITAEVAERLTNDVRVDDNLIDVRVEDGHVFLSGTVGSLAEKNRAESDGWVGGVKSVHVHDLSVAWWARDRMRRKTEYVLRGDDEIKKAVKDAFLYDPRVYSYEPQVQVESGVVTLSGVVEDLVAKKAAEEDARNTLGVLNVVNHLKVRPASIPADEELERRIGEVILKDPYVERLDIKINANNGLVYLTGNVNNSFEKKHAQRVVEGVAGVTDVINNIQFEHSWSWRPDWEIREEVKEELFWSPFVNEDQVSVTVDEGVVTLTGRVETWSERSSAEHNAWEGGAKDVRNKLSVVHSSVGPDVNMGYHYPYLFPDHR